MAGGRADGRAAGWLAGGQVHRVRALVKTNLSIALESAAVQETRRYDDERHRSLAAPMEYRISLAPAGALRLSRGIRGAREIESALRERERGRETERERERDRQTGERRRKRERQRETRTRRDESRGPTEPVYREELSE